MNRYWCHDRDMINIIPMIGIDLNRRDGSWWLGLKFYWGTLIAVIEIPLPNLMDLLRVLLAFMLTWALIITIAIISPLLISWCIIKAYLILFGDAFTAREPNAIMWVETSSKSQNIFSKGGRS